MCLSLHHYTQGEETKRQKKLFHKEKLTDTITLAINLVRLCKL